MNLPPRILILTAGFGEGHNAAARGLAAAFAAAAGPESTRVVDLFALATPRRDAIVRRAYLGVINRAPRLWSALYRWLDRADLFPRHLWLVRRAQRELEALLERKRPAAICCTYPVYAFMLAGRSPVPCFNVVTDSISINSLWWRAPCAGWFLPNPDSAEVLRAADVAPERCHVLGFPVGPFFREFEGKLVPPDLAAGAAPRVLYLINSGNHDDVLAKFLPLAFDHLSIVEDHVHEGPRGRYLVLHGDVFDTITRNFVFLSHLGDWGYQALLQINRACNTWRAWRGLEYWSLSKAIKARVKSAVSHVSNFEEHVAQLARERGCVGVICGHIHTPADKMLGDIHYLNSGDWVETLTAIVEHEDGHYELIDFVDFCRQFPLPAEDEPEAEAGAADSEALSPSFKTAP